MPRLGHPVGVSPDTDLSLPEGCTVRPLTREDLEPAFHVYSSAELEDSGVIAVERADIGPLSENMRVSFETEPDKRGKGKGRRLCDD